MALSFGPRVKLAKALLELSDNIIQDVKKDVETKTLPNSGWVPELTHEQFAKLYVPQKTEEKANVSAPAKLKLDMERWKRKIREVHKKDRLYIIATDDEALAEQKTKIINTTRLDYLKQILKDSPVKTKVVWATSTFLLGSYVSEKKHACHLRFCKTYRRKGNRAGWMNVSAQELINYIVTRRTMF